MRVSIFVNILYRADSVVGRNIRHGFLLQLSVSGIGVPILTTSKSVTFNGNRLWVSKPMSPHFRAVDLQQGPGDEYCRAFGATNLTSLMQTALLRVACFPFDFSGVQP